jgi:hypothetical protein
MMRIALLPLDERPVNTRYPQMIAAIAGAEVLLPPADLLSDLRAPAQCDALGDWLRDVAPTIDALIVDLGMLGFGGLIASRTTDDPPGVAIARLGVLGELKRARPDLQILAFNVITRVSNADDNIEEPLYWSEYGTRFYRFSQLLDRAARGEAVEEALRELRAELPLAYVDDFLRRRLRNHAFNLAALHLLHAGDVDLLVISSDDTSPYGLGSREKRWIAEWAALLGLDVDRLLMYPGADEVGCALLARLLMQRAGITPRFAVDYAIPEGAQIVAPYEDGPVATTVERQVAAVGGALVSGEHDLWLAVNPPAPRRSEWAPEHAAAERAAREPQLAAHVAQIAARAAAGEPVIIADVAYPNGADPLLVDLLCERVELPRLAAYGAWNTAGNTIGTALAEGCAALLVRDAAQQQAAERFLLHRLLEDWGYQQEARRATRAWLQATRGRSDPLPDDLAATRAYIEEQLAARLAELPGFAGRWRIVPGSVRLPWRRLFEVDFDLEPV